MNILKTIKFWLNNARVFSLPITLLNCLVIFIFALKQSNGNPYLGLLAILGSSLVHMARNLIDDYFDYKILIKDENLELYDDDDYFSHTPRLRTVFEEEEVVIEAPPPNQNPNADLPFLLTINSLSLMSIVKSETALVPLGYTL